MSKRFLTTTILSLSLLSGLLIYSPVQAGPVTGNPGEPPFTKAGVYGGVLSIVPGGGNPVLELGYNGTDIAGTSDLYFRPGSANVIVPANNAVRIYRSPTNFANLFVGGTLCLYGPTEDCRDVWSSGGAASSLWQVTTENEPGFGNLNYLEPIAAYSQHGLRLGSVAQPLTQAPAVDLTGWPGIQAVNYQADNAYALKVDGNVASTAGEYLTVEGAIRVNGQVPWHGYSVSGDYNQGIGSGLDADKIDGVDVRLEPASACVQSGFFPKLACICFYFQNGATKRCADLTNNDIP